MPVQSQIPYSLTPLRRQGFDGGSLRLFREATLGKRLREIRERLSLTQDYVAQHLGIPRQAVSEVEHKKFAVRMAMSVIMVRVGGFAHFPARAEKHPRRQTKNHHSGTELEIWLDRFRNSSL